MFKWGKQGFFNKTDSTDDGFFKFSIRPSRRNDVINFGVKCMIADCSERIYLEFDPISYNKNLNNIEEWKSCRRFLKDRRKKVKIFRSAVNQFCDALEKAYNDYESEMIISKPLEKEHNA